MPPRTAQAVEDALTESPTELRGAEVGREKHRQEPSFPMQHDLFEERGDESAALCVRGAHVIDQQVVGRKAGVERGATSFGIEQTSGELRELGEEDLVILV